jgi:hypothetical protein
LALVVSSPTPDLTGRGEGTGMVVSPLHEGEGDPPRDRDGNGNVESSSELPIPHRTVLVPSPAERLARQGHAASVGAAGSDNGE